MALNLPKKRKRKVKPFKYPHEFQVGDLVSIRDPLALHLKKRQPDILATIISITQENNTESVTLLFQDGRTKVYNLANMVLMMEKVS